MTLDDFMGLFGEIEELQRKAGKLDDAKKQVGYSLEKIALLERKLAVATRGLQEYVGLVADGQDMGVCARNTLSEIRGMN